MKSSPWLKTAILITLLTPAAFLHGQVDDFDEDPLGNPAWEYYEPVPGPSPSTDDGYWRMTLPAGLVLDHWLHVDNAPQLRRSDFPEDFIISTRVRFQGSGDPENPIWPPFNESYLANLMVQFAERDLFHWGFHRGTELVLQRTGTAPLCRIDPGLQELSLMITRTGSEYAFAWRENDTDPWEIVCRVQAAESPIYIGLLLKTWGPAITAEETFDFDYFSIEEVPETPPEIRLFCDTVNPDTAWIGMPYIRFVEGTGQPRPVLNLASGPEGLVYDPASATIRGWTPDDFEPVEITLEASTENDSSALTLGVNVASPSSLRDDDFDDDPAGSDTWELYEPQPGISYSQMEDDDGNTWWRMEVPRAGGFGQNFDTWSGVDRAPQLRMPVDPASDFLIETRLRIHPSPAPPATDPFLAGLLLHFGGSDIIHWNIGQQRTINGMQANLFLERSGINNIGHGWVDAILQGAPVQLRIEKRCDTYRFYYKGDEDPAWTFAREFTTPDALQSIGLVMKTWGGGASFTVDFDYFDIVEPGPRADFTIEPNEGQKPLTVSVDASPSSSPNGAITGYSWDFGDGSIGTGVSREHTYSERGTYTIRLTVTDETGDQGQATAEARAAFRPGEIEPWTLIGIGDPPPEVPGGARIEDDGCIDTVAGGDGIRSRSDQFNFIYRQLPSAGPFIARLDTAEWTGRAQTGFMIREDLDPDSKFAAMLFTDTGLRGLRYAFLRRETKGSTTRTRTSAENLDARGAWIRLEYTGGEAIGSRSIDGENWVELYRMAMDLPETAYVGIASSAQDRNDDTEFASSLCDISTGEGLPPPPVELCSNGIDDDGNGLSDCEDPQCSELAECAGPPGVPLVRGDANSDGSINLTDGVIPLLYLFSGGAAPACMDAADANDTGNIEITDAIIIFSWLFTGGAAPAPPSPTSPGYPAGDCGNDRTEDGIGCEQQAATCE